MAIAILNNDHNLYSLGFAAKETLQSAALYKHNTTDEANKMLDVLNWLSDALGTKEGMTHYRVCNGAISATNGEITASHPWSFGGGDFLVPGIEFEKIIKRMSGEPKLSLTKDGALIVKSGRFSGTVKTLSPTEWNCPDVKDAKFKPLPDNFLPLLAALKPFVSNVKTQPWATCVAIDAGWMLATNNIVIAGAACKGLEKINALLPLWAIDFVLDRKEGLKDWSINDNYVAFRWTSGAWMRSQLIVGKFSEKAAMMVRESAKAKPTQVVTEEFLEAFTRIAEMADDTVSIYRNRIVAGFGKAVVEDGIECEVPAGSDCSVFGAQFLLPAIREADCWSPGSWPKPSVFRGKLISGYCVGRRP